MDEKNPRATYDENGRLMSVLPTEASNASGMCALSFVFLFVGVASIILGVICAVNFTTDYSGYFSKTNTALVVLYLVGGVLTGLFNFALAVIVDACQKYREAYKG